MRVHQHQSALGLKPLMTSSWTRPIPLQETGGSSQLGSTTSSQASQSLSRCNGTATNGPERPSSPESFHRSTPRSPTPAADRSSSTRPPASTKTRLLSSASTPNSTLKTETQDRSTSSAHSGEGSTSHPSGAFDTSMSSVGPTAATQARPAPLSNVRTE